MQLLLNFFLKILLIDGIVFTLIILGVLIATPFILIKENMLRQAFMEEVKNGINDGSIKIDDIESTLVDDKNDKKSK